MHLPYGRINTLGWISLLSDKKKRSFETNTKNNENQSEAAQSQTNSRTNQEKETEKKKGKFHKRYDIHVKELKTSP